MGGAVARQLGIGFVPIRKKGKLPWRTIVETYALEYGTDSIEIHEDAFRKGQRVLVVDDLLATGGTMAAAVRLVRHAGAEMAGCAFVVELTFLSGRGKLPQVPVYSIVSY